jgi:hypothetical protein
LKSFKENPWFTHTLTIIPLPVILFSSSNLSLNYGSLDLITHKKFTLDSFNPIFISLSYCGEKNSHLFKGTKGKKKKIMKICIPFWSISSKPVKFKSLMVKRKELKLKN